MAVSRGQESSDAIHIKLFSVYSYDQKTLPERIYNPITAMGFSAMFTFQLDNTKR